MRLTLDHLVVATRTLAEGVAWCEATFGLRPEAGGQHAIMGTHNRVFTIASNAFPRAYVEIIAIDPSLPAPGRARWFDLDDAGLQRALAGGPKLVHWVARCDDIAAACAEMGAAGLDVGEPRTAERGTLRWQISLRADGHRQLGGAAPALIEWHGAHPGDALPASGVVLESMCVGGWPDAPAVWLPATIANDSSPGAAPISVRLSGPRGSVTLDPIRSPGA